MVTYEPTTERSSSEPLPPTTWQGWQQFIDTPPPTPPDPGAPPRGVEERLAYHSRFVTVRTPAIDKIDHRAHPHGHGPTPAGHRPPLPDRHRAPYHREDHRTPASRPDLPPRRNRPHRHPRPAPVAYVLVPPGASAKTLEAEFARFLGIPITHRMTQAQIMTTVCDTYTRVGVRLVMIDEIHRLNPRTSTGAEATDLLKDLTERIAATFVYAGIDVTAAPLFTGIRGAQLAGRATLIDCDTIPARRGAGQPFRDLVSAMEACLDLNRHSPGTLPRLAPYLHTRTAGRIGSLARLLRQAAITAILDNSERITKTALETIALDHLAEENNRPRYPANNTTRRRRSGHSNGRTATPAP